MNIIKKITAGTLALVLATGIAGSTLAEGRVSAPNVTSVQIIAQRDGGLLTASIGNLNFGVFEYSLADRVVPGEVFVEASDERGKATGWNVTVTGQDFNDEFGIDRLGLTEGTVSTDSKTKHSTEAPPTQYGVVGVPTTGGLSILSAPAKSGAGKYTATYDASLNIPAGTLVDTYTATLIVTITGGGPGED